MLTLNYTKSLLIVIIFNSISKVKFVIDKHKFGQNSEKVLAFSKAFSNVKARTQINNTW